VGLPGRRRPSGRIHLRGSAAGDHAAVRVRSQDGDRIHRVCCQRQDVASVLEQNDAVLFHPSRHLEAAQHIHDALPLRIVHQTSSELRAQHPACVVVHLRHRHCARLHRRLQPCAVKIIERLLVVEARSGRGNRAVRRSPVGDDKSLEVPFLLEHVAQQVFVLAGVGAVHGVVAAHHRLRVAHPQADLEGQQVAFPHRPLADDRVRLRAAALLVVHRIVLDIPDDVLRLLAADAMTHEGAGKHRVLPHVLEGAAVARLARDVHASA